MAHNDVVATGLSAAIMRSVGDRVAKIRLSRNITQASLARDAGASVSSIKRLEAGGNTSLDTFIRVLLALKLEDHLTGLLPDPDVRPIERVLLQGQQRQRASGKRATAKATDWAWAEDDLK